MVRSDRGGSAGTAQGVLRAHIPEGRRRRIAALVLAWYAVHRRRLPWRGRADPWSVLVSEILLHQTQVDRVVPVYEAFLARWPDPERCAAAAPEEVRALTDPLGYHVRGAWLHGIATAVHGRPAPHLPASVSELRRLRGVGRYTAGAVASIAFGAREPLVDTNVARLFTRLFRLAAGGRGVPAAQLWALASGLVPASSPGDFNQGLMELGALVCRPASPRCGVCPLETVCATRRPRLRSVGFEAARRPRSTAPARPAPDRRRRAVAEPQNAGAMAGVSRGRRRGPGGAR